MQNQPIDIVSLPSCLNECRCVEFKCITLMKKCIIIILNSNLNEIKLTLIKKYIIMLYNKELNMSNA